MPREELRKFLDEGGELNYDHSVTAFCDIKAGGIALDYNPLVYPPQHVLEEGKAAVKSYLEEYEDDMMESDKISLLLVGKQEVGKTALCNRSYVMSWVTKLNVKRIIYMRPCH